MALELLAYSMEQPAYFGIGWVIASSSLIQRATGLESCLLLSTGLLNFESQLPWSRRLRKVVLAPFLGSAAKS